MAHLESSHRKLCLHHAYISLKDKVLCGLQYMCTYVDVLYCVLFYWYLSRSRNLRHISMLFIDNKDSVLCILNSMYLSRSRNLRHISMLLIDNKDCVLCIVNSIRFYLSWQAMSRFGRAVRRSVGKQRGLGSNPLRLSFLFKGCDLCGTLPSCDFVPHN